MRLFKHGDSLAIVVPDSITRAAGLKEGEELEFFQTDKGVFVLLTKNVLSQQVKESIIADLVTKTGSHKITPPSPTPTPVTLQPPTMPAAAPVVLARNPLGPKGFIVIDTELEAKQLSNRLEKEIKSGDVVGVRGFDKKFYIVSTALYQSLAPKIENLLKNKDTITATEAAQTLNLEEPCAIAILQVMKEQGELIEKKRGVFAPIK